MNNNLTYTQLDSFCILFKELTGIEYSREKIYLFENRLSKFVGPNKEFESYDKLLKALHKKKHITLREEFVNQLTTNFTYFFRESIHFRFLQHIILNKFKNFEEIRIWSAASSGGHEAYSMAIALDSIKKDINFNFDILGTDIAKDKIEIAKSGNYYFDEIEGHVHPLAIKKYFKRYENTYQINSLIKDRVKFAPLNIMGAYPFSKKFHIIFLRNILIYFKPAEKERILSNIANYLHPKGYLVISISESLTGLKTPFSHVAHSIYTHSS